MATCLVTGFLKEWRQKVVVSPKNPCSGPAPHAALHNLALAGTTCLVNKISLPDCSIHRLIFFWLPSSHSGYKNQFGRSKQNVVHQMHEQKLLSLKLKSSLPSLFCLEVILDKCELFMDNAFVVGVWLKVALCSDFNRTFLL